MRSAVGRNLAFREHVRGTAVSGKAEYHAVGVALKAKPFHATLLGVDPKLARIKGTKRKWSAKLKPSTEHLKLNFICESVNSLPVHRFQFLMKKCIEMQNWP